MDQTYAIFVYTIYTPLCLLTVCFFFFVGALDLDLDVWFAYHMWHRATVDSVLAVRIAPWRRQCFVALVVGL